MEPVKLVVQQGQNVLTSMKELKRVAHKKGKNRSSLFENFSANKHSFQVYTNIDASIRESSEVQSFLSQLQAFSNAFESVRYEFEGEVNLDEIEATYPKVIDAFNSMVTALGYPTETVKF